MPTELEMQIEELRSARKMYAADLGELNDAREDFEAENRDLITMCMARKEAVAYAEAKLRDLTLAAYAETCNKKPAAGVGIRIVKEVTCDEAEAIKWAVEAKALNCLSLQKANFKKVAEGLALPFVEIKEVATATIAKDL
jgi:hypothetical protein